MQKLCENTADLSSHNDYISFLPVLISPKNLLGEDMFEIYLDSLRLHCFFHPQFYFFSI